MASSKFAQNNFAIKLNYCPCKGCNSMLEELRQNYGMQINTDAEPGYATIRGTGDPKPIIKKVKKTKDWWKLSWEPSPPMNNQEMQIALPQKPVLEVHVNLGQHVVEQQPGYDYSDLERSISKKADDCYRNQNHELKLKSYSKRFTCNACKEDGFGPRFRCEQCDYELHEVCNSREPTIFCDLFKGSAFEFCHNKGHARSCNACGKGIHGYSYHCKAKGLNLHPPCSQLRCQLSIDDKVFVLGDKDRVLSDCLWCNRKEASSAKTRVPGWSYVSRCNEYKFHVHCIAEMVHEAWKQGADNTEDTSKAIETMELKLMAKYPNRKGGSSGVFWKTVRAILGIILSVLFGDPIGLIVSTVAAVQAN